MSAPELARRLRAAGIAVDVPVDRRCDYDPISGRARRVHLRHGGRETAISAHGLRMALGPGVVRSTLWDQCLLENGELRISGRGYGHGVGLPQASAWAMAREGQLAPAILQTYYAGAALRRRW